MAAIKYDDRRVQEKRAAAVGKLKFLAVPQRFFGIRPGQEGVKRAEEIIK